MVWYPSKGNPANNGKVYPTSENPPSGAATPYKYLFDNNPSRTPSRAGPSGSRANVPPSQVASRPQPSSSKTPPPKPAEKPKTPPPKPAEKSKKEKPPPKPKKEKSPPKPKKEKSPPKPKKEKSPPKPKKEKSPPKPKKDKSPPKAKKDKSPPKAKKEKSPPKPKKEKPPPKAKKEKSPPKVKKDKSPPKAKKEKPPPKPTEKAKKDKPPIPPKPNKEKVKQNKPAPTPPRSVDKSETPPYHHYPKMPTGVTTAAEKYKGSPNTKGNKPKKHRPTKSDLIWKALEKLKTMPPAPKSLKFLENLDSFFVQDSCQPIELWNGFETGTQYIVLSKNTQVMLTATEKTKCYKLCMCRTDRTFMYRLLDKDRKEILRISRPCSCKCCFGAKFCGDLCGHKILVTLADGSKAGEVVQKCCKMNGGCCSCGCRCCCTPMYVIYDCVGNPTLKITGPSCGFMCCCRMSTCCGGKYKIFSLIKDPVTLIQIGEIANNWIINGNQFVQRGIVTADSSLTIGSTFPPNLDVRTKATVLGAIFLLDFLHFEKEPCCGLCQFCC